MIAKSIYGYIYMVKNKVDNKIYIGQTSQKGGFSRRYKHNLPKYTDNIHLKRAIQKYGIDNFEINEEYDIAYSMEELDEKERKYINEFKATDHKYGYNIREGGSNGKLAESTKQMLREANLGKHYSDEVNHKKARNGKDNGMYGKKHSEDAINKMSQSRKGKYKGLESVRSKRIECITTGKIFNCMREAGEYYGIQSYTHISRVCSGELIYCGELSDGTKLEWRYAEENNYSDKEISNRKIGALKRSKKVICLTTNTVFNSQREAGEYYGIKYFRHISEVCCGHSMSCGKLADGTPLIWAYLEGD